MSKTRQKTAIRVGRLARTAHLYVWVELGLFLLIGIGASVALFLFLAQG